MTSSAVCVTIQDLGSLGELIAALATLVTLFYLALQIRANTVLAKAEAKRGQQSASAASSLGGTRITFLPSFNSGAT